MRPLRLIALTVLLTACIPMKQAQIVGGRGYDHFGYYGKIGYGLLQIGPSNARNRITVIDSQSYAISPRDIRFRIETEPHPYDVETKSPKAPYVRDRVYVLDSEGHRMKKPLKDGKWKFHFTFRTPKGIERETFLPTCGPFTTIR